MRPRKSRFFTAKQATLSVPSSVTGLPARSSTLLTVTVYMLALGPMSADRARWTTFRFEPSRVAPVTVAPVTA